MSKIETEVNKMAKSLQNVLDGTNAELKVIIKSLSKEELVERIKDLDEGEKVILKSVLEEMRAEKLAKSDKAVEFDKDYAASYVKNNINETVIQEDKADDDQDEKLVKPEAAKINHQGDRTPEGRDDHVIKSEEMNDEDDMAKMYKMLQDSDDMMYKMLYKMCGTYNKSYIAKKCMEKGMDGDKVSSMIDRAMAQHEQEMHKSEEKQEVQSTEPKKEEPKSEDKEEKAPEEKQMPLPGIKKADEEETDMEKAEDSKESEADSNETVESVLKSSFWNQENALLKANTQGRNHNFSINQFYDEALTKSEEVETELKKSTTEESEDDVNSLIATGKDCRQEDIVAKSLEIEAKAKQNGSLIKSFSDVDLATALGLTEEETKKLLGE